MSAKWVAERQTAIFTIVRNEIIDKWKTTYPNLYFTREEDNDELETNLYPAIYMSFSEREVGRTFQTGVNACQMKIYIDVSVAESMGLEACNDIIYSIVDILDKTFGFTLADFPANISMDKSIKRMVASTDYLTIGYNDGLYIE